jgi:hypothetical protein
MKPSKIMDDVHENEIEERDVTAEQQHRNDDDESRISQLLVTPDSFFLRIPRPGSFLKLDSYFVQEVFRSRNHWLFKTTSNIQRSTSNAQLSGSEFEVQGSTLGVRRLQSFPHARRDSNPQQAVLETATLPIELLA